MKTEEEIQKRLRNPTVREIFDRCPYLQYDLDRIPWFKGFKDALKWILGKPAVDLEGNLMGKEPP